MHVLALSLTAPVTAKGLPNKSFPGFYHGFVLSQLLSTARGAREENAGA